VDSNEERPPAWNTLTWTKRGKKENTFFFAIMRCQRRLVYIFSRGKGKAAGEETAGSQSRKAIDGGKIGQISIDATPPPMEKNPGTQRLKRNHGVRLMEHLQAGRWDLAARTPDHNGLMWSPKKGYCETQCGIIKTRERGATVFRGRIQVQSSKNNSTPNLGFASRPRAREGRFCRSRQEKNIKSSSSSSKLRLSDSSLEGYQVRSIATDRRKRGTASASRIKGGDARRSREKFQTGRCDGGPTQKENTEEKSRILSWIPTITVEEKTKQNLSRKHGTISAANLEKSWGYHYGQNAAYLLGERHQGSGSETVPINPK